MTNLQRREAEARQNEVAYMLTQYANSFNMVDEDSIVEMLADELCIENADAWLCEYNEYLAEENRVEDYIYSWDMLDDLLAEYTPTEILRMGFFGNIESWSDEYFFFNGYENIETLSEHQLKKQMLEDEDFKQWYVETYEMPSEEEVEAILRDCRTLLSLGY